MQAKIIKTETEYNIALERIEEIFDVQPHTVEGDEFELLSMLVEMYEDKEYKISLPDPVEAIKFRMEQENLSQKDLVPYIGSKSKVSEVLNRKRNLSLSMIRSLHEGLGIPAEVLIHQENKSIPEKQFSYKQFPFTEMFKRKYFAWFNGNLYKAKDHAEELLNSLFNGLDIKEIESALYRKSSKTEADPYALFAWRARILSLSKNDEIYDFNPEKITKDLINEIVKLSYFKNGPLLARELLNKKGIHLLILKHLTKTYVDGAAMFSGAGKPIICLTLRHNRLDNFWFTLLHELAHVYLHLKETNDVFIDDLDKELVGDKEKEADIFAQNLLINEIIWKKYKKQFLQHQNFTLLHSLAEELHVSPSIIAGRIRKAKGNYTIYSELINEHKTRDFFPEWYS